jgi:hypothetical protein
MPPVLVPAIRHHDGPKDHHHLMSVSRLVRVFGVSLSVARPRRHSVRWLDVEANYSLLKGTMLDMSSSLAKNIDCCRLI